MLGRKKGIPTGPRRFEKADWAEVIKRNVYPHSSEVDWDEYVEWVSQGGGDEWFQAEEAEEALFGAEPQEVEAAPPVECKWCYMSTGRCSHIHMCSMMAGYIDAQMKQRMAYTSKAMVRPLRTSLNDRLVALVLEAMKTNHINGNR